MLQNLLPKKHKKKLTFEYFFRLGIVSAFLLASSFMVGAIALLPSYVKMVDELNSKKRELSVRQENTEDSKLLNIEVKRTAAVLGLMERDLQGEKITDLIDETLQYRPDGISVIGYSYDKEKRTLTLKGVAATRDLVAPYARNLEASELFQEVPIPFSDLAKNTDLKFLLTLRLKEEN